MKECEQGIVARDRVHHSCCDEVRALELQGLHRIRELDKTAAEWQAKCESAWAQLEAANLQVRAVEFQLKDAREAIQTQRREVEELREWARGHWDADAPLLKKLDSILYTPYAEKRKCLHPGLMGAPRNDTFECPQCGETVSR